MTRLARTLSLALTACAFAVPASTGAAHAATVDTTRHAVRAAQVATMPTRASSLGWTSNWAGYQASVKGPQMIHASWLLPRASWPNRDGYSATWVGLGGGRAGQGELVQAGTESDITCAAVKQHRCTAWHTNYYAWIETYPTRAQERITNLPVAPGDAIDVTVRWNASTHRTDFTVCNWRHDACVGASRASAAPTSVAQAVVERTSDLRGRPRALANIGTVDLHGVEIKGAAGTRNLNAWPSRRITMFNGNTLATSGPISAYGDSFSVTSRRPA